MTGFIHLRLTIISSAIALSSWSGISQSAINNHQQLAELVNQALTLNPDIQAAEAAVEVARFELQASGQPLNNPEFEAEAETTDIQTYTVGISQTFDWHDKRSAYQQVAEAELKATELQLTKLRLEKMTALCDIFGKLATRQKVISISERRRNILQRFSELAGKRYNAGDIPLSERELARLSVSEAMMQHTLNISESTRLKADYFSITGQYPPSAIQLPAAPAVFPISANKTTLAQQHPSVLEANQTAQAARLQINASDQERKTDPSFGLAAGREGDETLLRLSFSIPLQIRNNYQGKVDASQARALQADKLAQQNYQNLLAQLQAAEDHYKLVASTWASWNSAGRNSLQQRTELLEKQWRAGEMNTTDYLLQIQQTLNTQIAGVELHGDLWSAWITWLSTSATLSNWLNQTTMGQ